MSNYPPPATATELTTDSCCRPSGSVDDVRLRGVSHVTLSTGARAHEAVVVATLAETSSALTIVAATAATPTSSPVSASVPAPTPAPIPSAAANLDAPVATPADDPEGGTNDADDKEEVAENTHDAGPQETEADPCAEAASALSNEATRASPAPAAPLQVQSCAILRTGKALAVAIDTDGMVQLFHGDAGALEHCASLAVSNEDVAPTGHNHHPVGTTEATAGTRKATAAVLSKHGGWVAITTLEREVAVYQINLDVLTAVPPPETDTSDDHESEEAPPAVTTLAVTLRLPPVQPIAGLPKDCVDVISAAVRPVPKRARSARHVDPGEREPLCTFCTLDRTDVPWIFAAWPGHNQVFRKEAVVGGDPAMPAKAWTFTSAITAITSSSDGHVAVGLGSGAVSVWNVGTGFPAPLCPGGSTAAVSSLSFGPPSHLVVTHAGPGPAAVLNYRKATAVALRTDLVVPDGQRLTSAIPAIASKGSAPVISVTAIAGSSDVVYVAANHRVVAYSPHTAAARCVYSFAADQRVTDITTTEESAFVTVETAGCGPDDGVSPARR